MVTFKSFASFFFFKLQYAYIEIPADRNAKSSCSSILYCETKVTNASAYMICETLKYSPEFWFAAHILDGVECN